MDKLFTVKNGIKYCHIHNESPISFFGIVCLNGANYEYSSQHGISHFCEHMFFKGTKTRDYNQINNDLGLLGAKPNAFTSRQAVVYHATCPSFNFQATASIICDMFFNSLFPEEELEKERKVILEERKMHNDHKEASFMEYVFQKSFGERVGHSILGLKENIEGITRDDVLSYLKQTLNKENVVFVSSGPNLFEELVKVVEGFEPSSFLAEINNNLEIEKELLSHQIKFSFPEENNQLKYYREQMEQAHYSYNFSLGYKLINRKPIRKPYVCKIALDALGGGMYSVLFDEIREKRGLCYGIHCGSFSPNYFGKGLGFIDSQTSHERLGEMDSAIREVIQKVIKEGLPQMAFDCAKANAISSLAHASEKSASKVGDKSELAIAFGNQYSEEEKIKIYQEISLKEVNDSLVEMLSNDNNFTALMMDSKYEGM